jgi:signal transduction histidine kinase
MRLRWPVPDTVATRVAMVMLAMVVFTVALNGLLFFFGGELEKPHRSENDLLHDVVMTTKLFELSEPQRRPALAGALDGDRFFVRWYPVRPLGLSGAGVETEGAVLSRLRAQLGTPDREIMVVRERALPPDSPLLDYDRTEITDPRFLTILLNDGSWLVFTGDMSLLENRALRFGLRLVVMFIAIVAASIWVARLFSAPLAYFIDAAERFGIDPQAMPIPARGPREIQRAIRSFNGMQQRIQRFVADRTQMIAAISHDLRTPITRLRLRSEFIEDEDEQKKMLEDLDQMEGMVAETLDFVRDDRTQEKRVDFDLPVLLQSIVDDLADAGQPASFAGPDHGKFTGRPMALRRALNNLLENAIKYGERANLAVERREHGWNIRIADIGLGIPAALREIVFTPFFRIESSRNRETGGTGLGLSIARSIVRAHGGDIGFRDPPAGGFEVEVWLPMTVSGP